MNFVIPMAGRGSRFKKIGIDTPKFLIEVKNKKLLQYSLKSLPLELATKVIFIGLTEHNIEFNIKKELKNILPEKLSFELILIDDVTQGQAETVYLAKKHIDFTKDLVIFNIDTYFYSKSLADKLSSSSKKDGVLGAFKDTGTNWSFAKIDKKGEVIETTEKIPISDNALTGLYHFTNPNDFFETFEYYHSNNFKFNNEYYVAPMYNYLIQKGKKFVLDFTDEFIPLGTPEEIKGFEPTFNY